MKLCEGIAGKELNWSYSELNRSGDHIWWISDVRKFKSYYTDWDFEYDVWDILEQIHAKIIERFHGTEV